MVPGKIIVTGLIVATAFAGCVKKKNGDDKESAATPAVTTPTPAQSQDIFDEFYKADSTSAPKSESKASKKASSKRSSSGVAPSFVEGGRYVLQVATLPSRKLAEATSEKLNAKGFPSYVAEVQNPTPALTGTFYRVRVGGFSGTAAARSFGEQSLTPEGFEFWVDNRSNDNVGLSGSGLGSGSSSSYGSDPLPTSEYQSSPSEPAPEPAPVQTSNSSGAQPSAPAASAPAPAPSAAPASGNSTTKQSEWGNDGW